MILRCHWISDRACQDYLEIIRTKWNNLPLSVVDISIYRRKGNSMIDKRIRLIAAIGASAAVMIGAVAVGINQDPSSLGADARSGVSTGATVTESVAPKTPPVTRATPGMTGPALLPPEERGLPG
jgi:hypothetical protein